MMVEKEVQITISGVPETLVEKLNALAAREHRNRSQQLVKMLSEIVAEREAAETGSRRKAA